MKLQPAAKKTTCIIAFGSFVGFALMLAGFLVLHVLDIFAFRYTIILGGIAGTLVAILNFVLMCLTIQSAAQIEDKKRMKAKLQLSYNGRMALQAGWVVASFFIPWFQPVAAALPLLFPTVVIIWLRNSGKLVEPSQRKNEDVPAEETEN